MVNAIVTIYSRIPSRYLQHFVVITILTRQKAAIIRISSYCGQTWPRVSSASASAQKIAGDRLTGLSLRDRYRGQGTTILAGAGLVRAPALASKRFCHRRIKDAQGSEEGRGRQRSARDDDAGSGGAGRQQRRQYRGLREGERSAVD